MFSLRRLNWTFGLTIHFKHVFMKYRLNEIIEYYLFSFVCHILLFAFQTEYKLFKDFHYENQSFSLNPQTSKMYILMNVTCYHHNVEAADPRNCLTENIWHTPSAGTGNSRFDCQLAWHWAVSSRWSHLRHQPEKYCLNHIN